MDRERGVAGGVVEVVDVADAVVVGVVVVGVVVVDGVTPTVVDGLSAVATPFPPSVVDVSVAAHAVEVMSNPRRGSAHMAVSTGPRPRLGCGARSLLEVIGMVVSFMRRWPFGSMGAGGVMVAASLSACFVGW
jgi:hypothetical protein